MRTNAKGFTFIELLMVIAMVAIIGFYLVVARTICLGNQWFTSDGVLSKIQITETNAVSVATYQRNVFKKSVITVKMKDGSYKNFLLDSDILFNYALTDQK